MNTDNLDTIVAIATARGEGAISIIRLSGSDSLDLAKQITNKNTFHPRIATLCKVFDISDKTLIDEVIVIFFENPNSFTGENIVEIQCHGGIAVTNLILDQLLKLGARVANPGEFSKRAFENGKIDLTKAEAIAQMISSKSEEAVKLLARQLNGELQLFVEKIREDLIFALACSEVGIDYAEEDLPPDLTQAIHQKLEHTSHILKQSIDISKRRDGMIDGYKICIIGKPNVGKSSILNSLLNYERAIVSDIAGTTRDTIEENIKIGTHLIKIVDTAGIRSANDEIEKIGIARSKSAMEEAKIIVCVFDGSRKFDDEDSQILDLINSAQEKEIICVLNKSDLQQQFDFSKLQNFIQISSKTTISPLISKITDILDANSDSDDVTLISKRQIQCVENCLGNLENAIDLLQELQLELFSYHIKEAITNISDISRPFDNDQMLDVMFNSFCLGK